MTVYDAWDPQKAAGIVSEYAGVEGALLPVLHALVSAFGHLPPEATPLVAAALNLSRADVHGVITFYHDFRTEPPARHVLRLCRAEACQARGGEALAAYAQARMDGGGPAGDVALEAVYCLGLCASGPAAMIDGRPVARLTEARLGALLAEVGR